MGSGYKIDTSRFHAAVPRWYAEIVRNTREKAEAVAEEIAKAARLKWPLGPRTGKPHSRSLFATRTLKSVERLKVTIRNKAGEEYAYFIRTKQNGINGNPWKKLIVEPMKRGAEPLAADLGNDAARLVTRG